MNEWWISGGCTISTYSGTSRTTAGTNSVVRTSPIRRRPYFGRSTESAKPAVVATTSCENQDPIASSTVFQKYRPTSTVDQASRRLLHAAPWGNSDIGWLIV